ncbi:unnamed protein product [Ectocarpus sp. 12 AP-2014]
MTVHLMCFVSLKVSRYGPACSTDFDVFSFFLLTMSTTLPAEPLVSADPSEPGCVLEKCLEVSQPVDLDERGKRV